ADNGDVIDCVDIYKQLAFDHPLMKKHTLHMQPSLHNHGVQSNNAILDSMLDMSWRKNGGCPKGSVPIVLHVLTDYPILKTDMLYGNSKVPVHHEGSNATITIWDPKLGPQGVFSLSHIWIAGARRTQTIEAGWQPDGYRTGCYDLTCPGWVLVSQNYSPGMTLQPSTYGGNQSELPMKIERSIYNRGPLATSGADTILWGGEIAGYGSDWGYPSKTQMGSGHFPSEGYRNASYVRDLVYTDTSGKPTTLAQNQLNGYASVPNCYKYEFEQLNSSLYFFYGGAGCN
ncbi:hypothetical protein Ancab_012361, partial [Ancistrocladus abbreviatus]